MDYCKCTTKVTDRLIVVKERRSKFQLKNDNKATISKVQVDGCLIPDNTEKCDWILAEDVIKKVYYIELKGCGLDKAIKQLKSTLVRTEERYKDYKKECFAVTTRVPKMNTSSQKIKLDFKRHTKSNLTIINKQGEATL